MKKGTKIGLGVFGVLFTALSLSSCTKSFCTPTDTARIMYAFEPGVTRYLPGGSASDVIEFQDPNTSQVVYTIKGIQLEYATYSQGVFTFTESRPQYGYKAVQLTYLNDIVNTCRQNGYITIEGTSLPYLKALDEVVLKNICLEAKYYSGQTAIVRDFSDMTTEAGQRAYADFQRDIAKYSYKKFVDGDGDTDLCTAYYRHDKEVRKMPGIEVDICPSNDFISVYCNKVSAYASQYRTCLTTKEDKYGTYGLDAREVIINSKSWGFAWSKGFFEGLLVYPIGWLIDQIVGGFRGTGVSAGAAAFLGIVFITLIIRSLMLLATFKSTKNNAKMTELQPEIQKIQNKYPNSNSSQVEKQRMAEEMQRLYKKNKINPLSSLLIMVIQFPVFICVWGALSGASAITNGTVLGLRMDLGIKDVLFNANNWTGVGNYAAVTAFFLFLLMAGAQTVSMLLPQWMQKAKAKKVAKLGKNPAQNSQNKQMKIFTYVMLALIIFMGFSLVSAMGIYWFIGALFSIVQTLITQLVMDKKARK